MAESTRLSSGFFHSSKTWERLLEDFLACHRTALNATLHAVTTPLGVFATISLLRLASPAFAWCATGLYMLALVRHLNWRIWLGTAGVLAGLCIASATVQPGLLPSLALLAASVALQELAHILAGEPTLQSTYMSSRNWVWQLAEHTFFLLPLVLKAVTRAESSPLSLVVPRNAVGRVRLETPEYRTDIEKVRGFVEARKPTLHHTTHWWQRGLEPETQAAFARLAGAEPITSMLRDFHGERYSVEGIPEMNEIYVTGPAEKLSSDKVFYTPHIDGPWAVYPLAAVYRCMLAISPNEHIRTFFPQNSAPEKEPEGYTLTTGDALAFDYNREPHYIAGVPDTQPSGHRISLKLHFVVYPQKLGWYGRRLSRLSAWYNTKARQLFLDTIRPKTVLSKLQAAWILASTVLFNGVTRYIGWNNLAFVVGLALLSALLGNMVWFLAGTSFVHYLIYIGVYAHHRNVSFGRFIRNAIFFKTLATAQLAGWYLYFFQWDLVSLALIGLGFGLATWSFRVLGLERTYFGVELGRCPPKMINQFPYGVIPHPMILGSSIALLGFHKLEPFREQWPWLVPAHLAFYAIHLLQEIRGSQSALETEAGRAENDLKATTDIEAPSRESKVEEAERQMSTAN